jgi:hypothetical protein
VAEIFAEDGCSVRRVAVRAFANSSQHHDSSIPARVRLLLATSEQTLGRFASDWSRRPYSVNVASTGTDPDDMVTRLP